jgi:hypothetical protein
MPQKLKEVDVVVIGVGFAGAIRKIRRGIAPEIVTRQMRREDGRVRTNPKSAA